MSTDSRFREHWSQRFAGRLSIRIEPSRDAVLVELDGLPFLRVDEALETQVIGSAPWQSPEEEAEIRSGPGLITALALRGRWCLHASAVVYEDQAVLFLGDSGAGKSTLAREIATQCHGWSRLTDDLTPVELLGAQLVAWPAFPQLKLAIEERWTGPLETAVPVRELYLLRPSLEGLVRIQELHAHAATLALLAHTAAARVFDDELLGRHLEFAATASNRAKAYLLDYPHQPGAPAQIAAQSARKGSAEGIANDA